MHSAQAYKSAMPRGILSGRSFLGWHFVRESFSARGILSRGVMSGIHGMDRSSERDGTLNLTYLLDYTPAFDVTNDERDIQRRSETTRFR